MKINGIEFKRTICPSCEKKRIVWPDGGLCPGCSGRQIPEPKDEFDVSNILKKTIAAAEGGE